jgi:hypothetical protein
MIYKANPPLYPKIINHRIGLKRYLATGNISAQKKVGYIGNNTIFATGNITTTMTTVISP